MKKSGPVRSGDPGGHLIDLRPPIQSIKLIVLILYNLGCRTCVESVITKQKKRLMMLIKLVYSIAGGLVIYIYAAEQEK